MVWLKKEMPPKEEKRGTKRPRAGRPQQYIKPVAENFKRTKQGNRLVQQQIRRLLDEQQRVFPHKPMWTVDKDSVRFTDKGQTHTIQCRDLMQKAPVFFSTYFATIRKKLDYGHRVHKWLSDVSWLYVFHFISFTIYAGRTW